MITYENIGNMGRFGNQLFQIASAIGYAKDRGLEYGFMPWHYQQYFVNPLPEIKLGCVTSLSGYLQDFNNFHAHRDLISHYFEMKSKPVVSKVAIHWRDYASEGCDGVHPMQPIEYYQQAMAMFPNMEFMVFSDNINGAKEFFGQGYEYHEGGEMEAFAMMRRAPGVIASNSSFSWWAGYLSGKTVLPLNWYAGRKKGIDITGLKFPTSIWI